MRHIYLILISFPFLFACRKNTPARVSASEYFPNSVGDFWRYKFVDSVSSKSVFVDINIIGTTILPDGHNAKIWSYTFPDHIDTNFVYQTGDTIRFVDRGFTIFYTYIVPLSLGRQWRANPYYASDSIRIADNHDFYLNSQTFINSFLLREVGYLPNDHWDKLEWFCPTIGMITKTEKDAFTIGNEFSNLYWELVSYNLK